MALRTNSNPKLKLSIIYPKILMETMTLTIKIGYAISFLYLFGYKNYFKFVFIPERVYFYIPPSYYTPTGIIHLTHSKLYPLGYNNLTTMEDYQKSNSTLSLSEFVKKKRKELNLTQVDLADKAGVGLRFIRELEQDKITLKMDKVNEVLYLFGYQLGPVLLNREKLIHEKS